MHPHIHPYTVLMNSSFIEMIFPYHILIKSPFCHISNCRWCSSLDNHLWMILWGVSVLDFPRRLQRAQWRFLTASDPRDLGTQGPLSTTRGLWHWDTLGISIEKGWCSIYDPQMGWFIGFMINSVYHITNLRTCHGQEHIKTPLAGSGPQLLRPQIAILFISLQPPLLEHSEWI